MIDDIDFKNVDKFRDKLATRFPRIKDIHWSVFAEELCDALQVDIHKTIRNDLFDVYVKSLYGRYSNDAKSLTPYIPTSVAYSMINVTKTLIANNKHYMSIDDLIEDAIDYLINDRIAYSRGFVTNTNYMGMPIFPEKEKIREEPAFAYVCAGRGGGKSYSQLKKKLDEILNKDKRLKFCNPVEFKVPMGKKIGDVINIEECDDGFLAKIKLDDKPHDDSVGTLRYILADVDNLYERFMNAFYGVKEKEEMNKIPYRFMIEKVIFNDPATIVYWENGDKTVVKCQNGETFDPEKGLAMAISKRALGDCHEYYETFKKYVGKYYKQEMKKSSAKIADLVLDDAPQEEITEAIKESKDIIDKKPKKGKK